MNKDFIYKRRLLKLADFLMKLPSKKFDFSSWVHEDFNGTLTASCNTTACALGWATTIPAFKKAGLRMVDGCIKLAGDPKSCPEDAAAVIFGLSLDEFDFLFIPRDHFYTHKMGPALPKNATAKTVAKRIKKFAEQRFGK